MIYRNVNVWKKNIAKWKTDGKKIKNIFKIFAVIFFIFQKCKEILPKFGMERSSLLRCDIKSLK